MTSSPLYIIGTRHCLFERGDGTIGIGCEVHSLDEWLEHAEDIGADNDYTTQEIAEYRAYLQLAATLRELRAESVEQASSAPEPPVTQEPEKGQDSEAKMSQGDGAGTMPAE